MNASHCIHRMTILYVSNYHLHLDLYLHLHLLLLLSSLSANQSLPLHYFVRMNAQTTRPALYERLFRTMLQKGAEVNTQNLQGDTPLHMAAFRGREKSVSLLLWNQADPNLRNKYESLLCVVFVPRRPRCLLTQHRCVCIMV
jgi:ankyrin repeat protein